MGWGELVHTPGHDYKSRFRVLVRVLTLQIEFEKVCCPHFTGKIGF